MTPPPALPVDEQLEEALALAAAEVSAFSVHAALPALEELALRRTPVLSAKVDAHFGSVEMIFPEHAFTCAVKDLGEANSLVAACRVARPVLLGALAQDGAPGAMLLISAPPWSIYLEVLSVREPSNLV